MKVYHRIFGDPPNKGFDNSIISSVGFPGGARFVDAIKNVRLPRAKGVETREGEFIIYHEAFEYQTIAFGQPALIHSVFAGKTSSGAASRPHGFTHVAAPKCDTPKRLTTDEISPAQLLQYNELLTLPEFWDIPRNTETWPVTEWTPPAATRQTTFADLPQEMAEALILRYWRAASASFFSDSPAQQPVEICLGEETDRQAIITAAKAFFSAEILPRLPEAVYPILSMSVPAYQNPDSVQSFQPTALTFLIPDREFEAHESFFDLRDRRYAPLDAWHTAFIRRRMGGEVSPGLRHALDIYRRHTDCPDPARCTLMADYFVSYGMESIECRRIDARQAPAELLSIWRSLLQRLTQYHHTDSAVAQEMLRTVVRSALGQLTALGAAFSLNKEQLAFLFSQALAMGKGPEYEEILLLITRHQTARLEPFFLASLPWQELPQKAGDLAELMDGLLTDCYVEAAPDAPVLQALASPKLASLCKEHAELQQAVERYIDLLAHRHPEISIDLLPLARRYSDPAVILYNTLHLLISRQADAAPDADVLDDLKHLLAKANNPELQALLARYFTGLYLGHPDAPDVFLQTAQAIAVDMTSAVQAILRTAAETSEDLDRPLSRERLNVLTAGLISQIERPEEVRLSLAAYAEAVVRRALDTDFRWFPWLFGLDSLGDWLPEAVRCEISVRYLPAWMQRRSALLSPGEFDRFLACVKGNYERLFLQSESAYAAAYEQLTDRGEDQLNQLFPLFQHVADTRYVRAKYLEWLQGRAVHYFTEDLRTLPDAAREAQAAEPVLPDEMYWSLVEKLRLRLSYCGEMPEALLAPRVREAAEAVLQKLFAVSGLRTAGYEALFESRSRRQSADAFFTLWHEALIRQFVFHYGQTLSRPLGSLLELRELDAAETAIGADQALADSTEERYCREVLRAEAFLTSPETQYSPSMVKDTMNLVHSIRKLMAETQTEQPMLLLYRHCLQPDIYGRIRDYRFKARVAAGLLITCRANSAFSLRQMMPLLLGPEVSVPEQPYAPESLAYLQAIAALFAQIADFDSRYPMLLSDELTSDPELAKYTSRLQKDKRTLSAYFPQCAQNATAPGWQANPPLSAWLARGAR